MAWAAFTDSLMDKDLVKFLYLNFLKNFDDIMNKARDLVTVDKALQFTDNEAR